MARVTWRQHRGALITLVAASAALALAIAAGELDVQGPYARYAAEGCIIRPIHVPCGTLANTIAAGTNGLDALVIALHVLPVLIGVFLGAPLIARELESGTFRFTWTQGVGRTRFVVTTIVLLAAVVTVATCALGALLTWYAHPFEVVGLESRFQAGFFDTTALAFPAWTLFALCIGTFLGTLIGRVVTAMAAAAAAAGGLLVAAFWELDHHLLSLGALARPVQPTGGLFLGVLNMAAEPGLGPAGSWLVRGWITGPGGYQLSSTAARQPSEPHERGYQQAENQRSCMDVTPPLHILAQLPASGPLLVLPGDHRCGTRCTGNRLRDDDRLARPQPRVALGGHQSSY